VIVAAAAPTWRAADRDSLRLSGSHAHERAASMHGYDPATWAAFFAAVTGAAVALAGLLFVAVSINVDNILKNTMLPARAAETLAILLFVMISSALALVPQDVELLGAEILVIAVPLTAITARSQL
jgi:hypothetical protein